MVLFVVYTSRSPFIPAARRPAAQRPWIALFPGHLMDLARNIAMARWPPGSRSAVLTTQARPRLNQVSVILVGGAHHQDAYISSCRGASHSPKVVGRAPNSFVTNSYLAWYLALRFPTRSASPPIRAISISMPSICR